ncbi:hypothetical protein [Halapricum hydrolyticum]|uniref:Uncharacterized protein n=1 Tax=Halapricum hydrolyticum TaxID=2979991 RepID=A0AAE3ID69_9EURY|nr:hypothetical protein [Halapricum hydrolyticum]MCU4726394.1 hypothetical protein [Halapricum hydrolyticum]
MTLPDRHDIEELTLVDPGGQHFATRPVQTGVTQVRFELLDPRLWGADYVHYEPGTYELVGVSEERTEKQEIPLEPDIRIADVEQVRDEQLPKYLYGIAVTVENVGTGPTWVYDVAFANSPYGLADSELRDGIGDPIFAHPERDQVSTISPGEQRVFIDAGSPLVFYDSSVCDGSQHIMEVQVGIATGEEIDSEIRLTMGGEITEYFLSRRWMCDEIDIEITDGI